MEVQSIARTDAVTCVKLIGKLDIAGTNAADIRFHSLTAAQGNPCIVDLSEMTFIASIGMGMLVTCAQALSRNGSKMVLLNPQPKVAKALKIAGIDAACPIAESDDEALAILHGD